jgi:hypothetical protein
MHRMDLVAEIYSLMAGPPAPEPGPKAFLQFLSEAVYFPLSRIMDELDDAELDWAPVPDAKPMGWVATGHDPRIDPFTTIGWRWAHFCEELHGIATFDNCLGPEEAPWPEPTPQIMDAASAVANLTSGIRRAAKAIAAATDAQLDEHVENVFGRHTRRHWVAMFLMEATHHAAEIGVLRDLYRRRS